MDQLEFFKPKAVTESAWDKFATLTRPVRTLQIEADGDFWRGLVRPKIRLMGHWLERAGFKSGNRVQVTCVAPGVIELRSPDAAGTEATKPATTAQIDRPF